MLKDFNRRFGIVPSLEEEQKKFVNRAVTFFNKFKAFLLENGDYIKLFDTVCIQFGKNPEEYKMGFIGRRIPELTEASGDTFIDILRLFAVLREYYKHQKEYCDTIDETVEDLIEKAEIDLQISYSEGEFYPAKERLLDNDLIEFSLTALNNYPDEHKDFLIALRYYNASDKNGIIQYCYTCMEGLARKMLRNNKTLIDNKGEIQQRISVSDNWKKILFNYIEFGNEYSRHASGRRHQLTDKEAESYLYLTGLLIRLLTQ